jgi:hypothetical protein
MTANEIILTSARHSSFYLEYRAMVAGPIRIIAIVAFLSPIYDSLKYIDAAKRRLDQPGCAVRPISPFGRMWQKPGSLRIHGE